jgi:REP element-mobilizing transposase RayT
MKQSPNGAKVVSTTRRLSPRPKMPQSFASLHCHVVFSTKHRQPLISSDLQPRLYDYIGGILRNHSCALIAAGGIPDHVHLLVSLSRALSFGDTIRLVQSNSSSWIHEELQLRDFQWQTGYGAFAVSYSNIDTVKSYFANQERHIARNRFKTNFASYCDVMICNGTNGTCGIDEGLSPRWGSIGRISIFLPGASAPGY